jgi:hypothetical protein
MPKFEIDDDVAIPVTAKQRVANRAAELYYNNGEAYKTAAARKALAEDTSGAFKYTHPKSAVQYIVRRF